MRTRVAAAALTLLAALPLAAIAQEPATVGPTIYKQTLDNERVRVFEVTFKKGAEIAMHSHPDHAVYVVLGGKLEITLADGTKNVIEAKPGETFFLPAQAHSARNVGKGTIKVTVTELKDAAPSGTLSDAERGADPRPPRARPARARRARGEHPGRALGEEAGARPLVGRRGRRAPRARRKGSCSECCSRRSRRRRAPTGRSSRAACRRRTS